MTVMFGACVLLWAYVLANVAVFYTFWGNNLLKVIDGGNDSGSEQ